MELSRSSSHFPSSAKSLTHFSSATPPSSASTSQAHSSTETCLVSIQPFAKKYAWAVVGAFVAISGSVVLLACSSAQSSAKQARRCSAGQRRGLASQEVQRSRALIMHSQGTNTEVVEAAGGTGAEMITQAAEKGKERVIEDADVCSAVPEVIIRDTSDTGSSAAVHALIDTDTIDRSAPLTIYSSLMCAHASDTIRRPVSWSEPYMNKEEVEAFTSYHSQALDEPLKPNTHTPTQRKNIPNLGPSLSKSPANDHTTNPATPHPSSSDVHGLAPITRSSSRLFSSKLKETLDWYPCLAVRWSQVRIDLFLLLSTFSVLLYYFYLKRSIQKHIEIQPVKPFPLLFRMLP